MPESPYPGPPPAQPDPDDGPPEAAPTAEPSEGAADPAPEPQAPASCKVCGAELDPGQTYCLECGSPTPAAPKLRTGVGGLAAVAAGLAVLGLGAGALAFVASDDGSGSTGASVSQPATSPLITVPTASTPTTLTDSSLPGDTVMTTPTVPMDTTFTTPDVDTTGALPVDPTATVPDSGLVTETTPPDSGQTTSEFPSDGGTSGGTGTGDWPAGTSGWTAIVASDTTEAGARAAANRLEAQGQPGGVLFSSDHPPLRPGYWVAFSGTYTTRDEALSQARSLVASYPGASPRRLDS